MNTNEQCCIFLDIDGTLLGDDRSAFEENIATIQRVRALGHKVFLNTGRATSFIPVELKDNSKFDGIISGAGALSKIADKVLVECLVPHDIVLKYAEYSIKHRLPAVIEGTDHMYHFGFTKGLATESVEIIVGEDWIKLDSNNITSIITPDVPIEKLTVLSTDTEGLDVIVGNEYNVLKLPYHTEVIRKNHGKGDAMLEVAEILNIPVERTIAIGDSMNDYDMIKLAGIGIAMENAPDNLKADADMICGGVDDSGVSKVLIEIFNL